MLATRSDNPSASTEAVIEAVREALTTLSYGQVSITVHDNHVVQLEVTQKRRFAR